ncbi:MAG: hypothetical protein NZ699_01985 [Roseiflexus sp.]|nr:hypothetical protein [Roseiflexus sp.]MCS7287881.1 hypothetical protein [Roseiflexus sp.]MDW8144877.1 hypothetical protein [Roseiflexaceae bacterium]MDW8233769.1 hypothetical protein [Roseiflexaceae bacterium]
MQGDAPCVCRSSAQRFFCNTARNGGAAEFTVAFGEPLDAPLLGDVDGTGRDAACVYRPLTQRFLCDTARNGGAAEFEVAFGNPSDIPLIGSLGQPFGVALPLVVR